jgi:hypothetical protein
MDKSRHVGRRAAEAHLCIRRFTDACGSPDRERKEKACNQGPKAQRDRQFARKGLWSGKTALSTRFAAFYVDSIWVTYQIVMK